jgi:hypothetical protein
MEDLDGELWTSMLERLNPPDELPEPETVHDMCFRDAKALAGYVPDLRSMIKARSAKALPPEEMAALHAIRGILNFSARIPVLLLAMPDYKAHQNLIDLYNGYRSTLKEIDDYLALA